MNIQTKHEIGDTVAFISGNYVVEDIINYFYVDLEEGPTYGVGGSYTVPVDEIFDSRAEAIYHWLTSNGVEIDITTIIKHMENTQCQKH